MSQRLEHISCFDTQHVHAWDIDRDIKFWRQKKTKKLENTEQKRLTEERQRETGIERERERENSRKTFGKSFRCAALENVDSNGFT